MSPAKYWRTNSFVAFRKDICIRDSSVGSREDELVKSPVVPTSVEGFVGGGRGSVHLIIVTTNPTLAEVLAEDFREIRGVAADVVDLATVESGGFRPDRDHVMIVTEAAVGRWCRWRTRLESPLASMEVIGALGSRWLVHESPESGGFVGCIDFKWPARDLVRELHAFRKESSPTHAADETCQATSRGESLCHDDIDRRIVAYITMGLSDREIGAKVYLSSQTVRNRVSRMLDRSHVQNRTQLAMACVSDPRLMDVHRSDELSTPRKVS